MSAVGTTMTVVAALQAIQQLLNAATEINGLVQAANLEGRKSLTDEEWAKIKSRRDSALSRLDAAIAAAESNGGPIKMPAEKLAAKVNSVPPQTGEPTALPIAGGDKPGPGLLPPKVP